jgi:hypothetical protein
MTLHRYRLYGVNVESTRAIGLLEKTVFALPDVRVSWTAEDDPALRWERRSSADLDKRHSLRVYTADAQGVEWVKFCYAVGDAEIAFVTDPAARVVTIMCDAAVPEIDRDSLFVGPIMGAILRLRGTLVLHASAVEVDGRAVAFVGQKTSGKSTHAAAFMRRGHRVLADDMAALVQDDAGFRVESGYSRIRVRPGTAELIATDYETRLDPVYSFLHSFYAPLADAFHAGSLPLAAFYLLERGDSVRVRPLQPLQSLPLLGQNTFGNYAMTPIARRTEFAQLGALAAEVPVRALAVRYDIADLDAQYDAVMRDLFAAVA